VATPSFELDWDAGNDGTVPSQMTTEIQNMFAGCQLDFKKEIVHCKTIRDDQLYTVCKASNIWSFHIIVGDQENERVYPGGIMRCCTHQDWKALFVKSLQFPWKNPWVQINQDNSLILSTFF